MKKLSSPLELIKNSVNLFSEKKNLIFFLKIYWPLIPFAGFTLVQQNLINGKYVDTAAIWWIAATTILQIASLFVSLLVTIMGIEGVRKVVSKESLSVKECLTLAKKKFWKFALLSLVLGLLYVFGFALLIIPGMLFVVWFVFARFIAIDSNLKLGEILRKSKEMVKGMYWAILGRLLIFGLFMVAVQIVFSMIPFGLGSFVTSVMGALFLLPAYLLYKELK